MAAGIRKRPRHTVIGFAVVLVFLGAAVVAVTSQNGLPWASRTVVRADFDDVGSLRTGDDVRIANIRVGHVGEITYARGRAVVELEFDGERPIYRDARAVTASVGARSALGQKYVDYSPGGPDAGRLPPGKIIPATRTVGAQELSDVLDVLDKPTRDALRSTLREVGGGTAGHSADLRDALEEMPQLLPDLGTVSSALAAGDGADLTRMLRAVDTLAGRFHGRQKHIGALFGQLDTTFAAVGVDEGRPLGSSLRRAPSAMESVTDASDAARRPLADLSVAMAELREGADALGAATPDVRGVLTESPRPLRKVPPVARPAEAAVRALTGVMSDARPLAPQVADAFHQAKTPLRVLAPYTADMVTYFRNSASALGQGDKVGNWMRVYLLFSTESVSGAVQGVRDPISKRDPYPAPSSGGR